MAGTHDTPPQTSAFETLLRELLRLTQLLHLNIQAVADAATDTDYTRLDTLLAEEGALLETLNHQNQQLRQWLSDHGFADNAVSEAIQAQPDNDKLTAIWSEYKLVVADCQALNTANNILVNGQLQHARNTLNLITGNSGDADAPYTAMGRHNDNHTSRPWAKA